MNDFFSWRRELNIKKVIITVAIITFILIILINLIFSKYTQYKTEQELIEKENLKTTTIYTSSDNTFSIELSKDYELYKNANSSNYLLDLFSNSNLGIHISKIEPIENKSFHTIAKADRLAFSQSFNPYSNLSDLKEILVGNTKAYTYSFHYLDTNLNKAFYIQIVWLEIGTEYFVFDIDFPLDDLPFYSNVVTEVLSTFKRYQ